MAERLSTAAVVHIGGRAAAEATASIAPRPTDDVVADVRRATGTGARLVVLTGGDPLRRRDLPALLMAIEEAGARPGIVTTGTGLGSPAVRTLLAEHSLGYLRVAAPNVLSPATLGPVRAFLESGPPDVLVDLALAPESPFRAQEAAEALTAAEALRGDPRLRLCVVAPHRESSGWPPPDAVSALLRGASELGIETAWEGFPPCVLSDHGGARDERLRYGVPAYGPVQAASLLQREEPWRRSYPFPCQECRYEATCPGAPASFLANVGEDALQPTRGPVANSFNYELAGPVNGFRLRAGECTAQTLDLDLDRDLLLVTTEGVQLYRSPTADFTPAQLRHVRDDIAQLYIDQSSEAVLTEFLTSVRRVRPHSECPACPDRVRCCGAYVVDPALPFEAEEALLKARLRSLRGRVLDVGCGEQPYHEIIATAVADGRIDYTGLDPSVAALERVAGSVPGVALVEGVIETYQGPEGGFDAVLSFRSMNHFEDMRAAFANIARLLRPGGTLLACESVVFGLLRRPEQVAYADTKATTGQEHLRNWSSGQLVRFLERFPFAVTTERPVTADTADLWIVEARRRS